MSKMVKIATNVVGRRGGTINTRFGLITFDEKGIGEIAEESAVEFCMLSEGAVELVIEGQQNFVPVKSEITGIEEKTGPSAEELKKQEDLKISKELAKKNMQELQDLARLANLNPEEYIKLSKAALIKLLVEQQ